MEGGPSGDKKLEKSRTVPKENQKGDPLVPSGFVGCVLKIKKPKGGLWNN